ncbi:hypothetical protein GSI_09566 [Ganoderma sinense ZZ0214-1]|uniref:Uncharacterized protein n=1 Tax=Ganoderma sinense ZZ0214-1 TaxID=1077348 RepID=A0A2G8S3Y7_9APHY|nr:hypothetical protein GSI_09566 [Ganoderma sinense ZZ0214-1]
MSVSLADFVAGVDKLDATGKNFILFRDQFQIAVTQKEAWDHFSGTSVRPAPAIPATPTALEIASIAAWDKKENLALYLLNLKIAPAVFTKHKRKGNVAAIWASICSDMGAKSLLQRANLRRDFTNMRYTPGADLHAEVDRLRLAYENLITLEVKISDAEYASTIIAFLPHDLSAFVAQLSAQIRAHDLMTPATTTAAPVDPDKPPIDPEVMLTLVLEEWERRQGERKTTKGKDRDPGLAAAVLSSEKPKRGRGPHICPSPAPNKDDESNNLLQNQNPPPPPPANPAAAPAANTVARPYGAYNLDDIAGAWSALAPQLLDSDLDDDNASVCDPWSDDAASAYSDPTEDLEAAQSLPDLIPDAPAFAFAHPAHASPTTAAVDRPNTVSLEGEETLSLAKLTSSVCHESGDVCLPAVDDLTAVVDSPPGLSVPVRIAAPPNESLAVQDLPRDVCPPPGDVLTASFNALPAVSTPAIAASLVDLPDKLNMPALIDSASDRLPGPLPVISAHDVTCGSAAASLKPPFLVDVGGAFARISASPHALRSASEATAPFAHTYFFATFDTSPTSRARLDRIRRYADVYDTSISSVAAPSALHASVT